MTLINGVALKSAAPRGSVPPGCRCSCFLLLFISEEEIWEAGLCLAICMLFQSSHPVDDQFLSTKGSAVPAHACCTLMDMEQHKPTNQYIHLLQLRATTHHSIDLLHMFYELAPEWFQPYSQRGVSLLDIGARVSTWRLFNQESALLCSACNRKDNLPSFSKERRRFQQHY